MFSERLLTEIQPSTDFPTLTWQEMVYLHDSRLSLRGVDDEKQARHEQKSGGKGDAVSLATFAFFGAEGLAIRERVKTLYDLQEDQDGLYSKVFALSAYYFLRSEEVMREYPLDKELLRRRLLDGIEAPVNTCVESFGSRGFILMCRGPCAELPYDFGRYPLGKCGTASFTADKVKAVVTPDTQAPWDTQTAYRAVLLVIKRLCYENQLDRQSARALQKLSLLKNAPEPQALGQKINTPSKERCPYCIIL